MSTSIKTEGATGSKSKEGVIQWVIPYYVPDVSQVQIVGKEPYEGCTEVSRSWTCNHDGSTPSYIVTVTYEGGSTTSESESTTYGDADSQVWSLDFEMAEEPIASHWNWEKIKDKYKAVNLANDTRYHDDWAFPVTLEGGGSSSSSGLGNKGKSGDGEKNPMYGVTTYLVMTAVVSVSYAKKTLPGNVIQNIGKLYKEIPDAPSQFNNLDTGKRDWMKMPPQISKRGNVWQISESWRLSEYYEWPREVYSDGNAGNLT